MTSKPNENIVAPKYDLIDTDGHDGVTALFIAIPYTILLIALILKYMGVL